MLHRTNSRQVELKSMIKDSVPGDSTQLEDVVSQEAGQFLKLREPQKSNKMDSFVEFANNRVT